ncbi:hypothetical protein [Salinarimonas rosea]|uniref:hypothetical protein n=1 Tax=Salinarimonas rosea TaxID=552063 RepID=UPI00042A1263|nr:hypothetical protein [Salinarimonas rosea]
MAEEARGPFDPYVEELQAQERDIEKKIAILEGIIEQIGGFDAGKAQSLGQQLQSARKTLNERKKEIADAKIDDLEDELTILGRLARNPRGFEPAPPPPPASPPWWPPWWPFPPFPAPPGGGSGGGAKPSGAIDPAKAEAPPGGRWKVATASRDFIVARSAREVWVWHPVKQAWEAKLEAGDDIVAMEQVDGTIAVRTESRLWLFHPLDYVWLGPLVARIEEVKAFDLAYPAIVAVEQKKGEGKADG